MHINNNHLLDGVPYHPVPDDHKPQPSQMEREHPCLVVIHSIGLPPGEYGTDNVRQMFLGTLDYQSHPFHQRQWRKNGNRKLLVAAHIFLRRDGSLLQFVPFNEGANHAGESSYRGRTSCNRFSIGIELEGAVQDGYESIQYEKLVELSIALINKYPNITRNTFVGHNDIAPERRSDPWHFNWNRFRSSLRYSLMR